MKFRLGLVTQLCGCELHGTALQSTSPRYAISGSEHDAGGRLWLPLCVLGSAEPSPLPFLSIAAFCNSSKSEKNTLEEMCLNRMSVVLGEGQWRQLPAPLLPHSETPGLNLAVQRQSLCRDFGGWDFHQSRWGKLILASCCFHVVWKQMYVACVKEWLWVNDFCSWSWNWYETVLKEESTFTVSLQMQGPHWIPIVAPNKNTICLFE